MGFLSLNPVSRSQSLGQVLAANLPQELAAQLLQAHGGRRARLVGTKPSWEFRSGIDGVSGLYYGFQIVIKGSAMMCNA